MTVFKIASDIVAYPTLTALYGARDAGSLVAGNVYRVAWSGDAHVADGQIVTQFDGADFSPHPLGQVEFPAWLIDSSEWKLVNGQAIGALSFDGDGRPIMSLDATATGYAGVTLVTRYEYAYADFASRVEMTNTNLVGAGSFNRFAPVAFVGNDIDLSSGSFLPRFAMAGSFQSNQYFANSRLAAGGYSETTASLGRGWTASERGKFLFTANNDAADTSFGFAFGLEAGDTVDQIDSNNDGPELLESPLALRPAIMALLPNPGSAGTASLKLLSLRLTEFTGLTDPRVY